MILCRVHTRYYVMSSGIFKCNFTPKMADQRQTAAVCYINERVNYMYVFNRVLARGTLECP